MISVPENVLEATRLVRQGRLAEATALLRGAMMPAAPTVDLTSPPGIQRARRSLHVPGRAPSTPPAATFEQIDHRSTHGSRAYKLYVPSNYAGEPVPLIVMLHGCTQSPDDFAAGTRMNAQAEALGFLVAYPAQVRTANASRCWNWFNDSEQQRGHGEPAVIAGIVGDILRDFSVERDRVFLAGLSAGGAAAANLGALYPDVFAAIGVHSGLACGAARDVASAFSAMQRGSSSQPGPSAPLPAIIFHGDCDATVNIVNSSQVAAQARGGRTLTEVIDDGMAGGRSYTRTIGLDRNGRPVLEQWIVHGGGHAWFGGSASGSYTDTSGPDASAEMVRFFLGIGR